MLYDSDYVVTTSYRHGKFAYKHNKGYITFMTQHDKASSVGEFMILKENLKKQNLSFTIEPLDVNLTCVDGSSEKMRDLISVCHGLVLREMTEDERKQMQKIQINNPGKLGLSSNLCNLTNSDPSSSYKRGTLPNRL